MLSGVLWGDRMEARYQELAARVATKPILFPQASEWYPPLYGYEPFSVVEEADRFVLSPVAYRDGACRVTVHKAFHDDGNLRRQDDWIEWLRAHGTALASASLQLRAISALEQHFFGPEHETIQRLRDLLCSDVATGAPPIITGSRAVYGPADRALDGVVHDVGTPDAYLNVGGLSVSKGASSPVLCEVPAIDEAYGRIVSKLADIHIAHFRRLASLLTGRDPQLQLFSGHEDHEHEYVLTFSATPERRFLLNAMGGLYDCGRARRWDWERLAEPDHAPDSE